MFSVYYVLTLVYLAYEGSLLNIHPHHAIELVVNYANGE